VFLLMNKTPTTTGYRVITTDLPNSLPGESGEQTPHCAKPGTSTTDDG
jgi:hypothetical protein